MALRGLEPQDSTLVLTKEQIMEALARGKERGIPRPKILAGLRNRGYRLEGGWALPATSLESVGGTNPSSFQEGARWTAEALPALAAGLATGPAGNLGAKVGFKVLGRMITGRIPATLAGAGVAGAAGELGREGVYLGTGQGFPPPTAAAQFVQDYAGGALPQPVAEGVAQTGLQAVGEGLAAPFRFAGKKMAELSVGPSSMKHSPAEVVVREGIPISSRGLKRIAKDVGKLRDQIMQRLFNNQVRANVWDELAQPVWSELRDKALKDDNPEVALKLIDKKVSEWMKDPANGGAFIRWSRGPRMVGGGTPAVAPVINKNVTLSAQRLYYIKQSTGNKVATRWQRADWGRMHPVAASKARWESEFNEAMSNRARSLVHEAAPDVVALDKRASELLNASDEISRAIRPGFGPQALRMGLQHTPGLVLGTSALYSHAGSPIEKFGAGIAGLALGEIMASPELVKWLTETIKQVPRAANVYTTGAR